MESKPAPAVEALRPVAVARAPRALASTRPGVTQTVHHPGQYARPPAPFPYPFYPVWNKCCRRDSCSQPYAYGPGPGVPQGYYAYPPYVAPYYGQQYYTPGPAEYPTEPTDEYAPIETEPRPEPPSDCAAPASDAPDEDDFDRAVHASQVSVDDADGGMDVIGDDAEVADKGEADSVVLVLHPRSSVRGVGACTARTCRR